MRKKIWLAVIALMLIATAVEAQFSGMVQLVSGKKVTGYLVPEHGRLLVVNEKDTLRFSRAEIWQVFVGEKVEDFETREGGISTKLNLFASWMPIIPNRLLGGMSGFNIRSSRIYAANIGAFYHRGVGSEAYGENIQSIVQGVSYNIETRRRNEYDSRSFGLIYAVKIRGHELFFMGGKIETNYKAYIEQDGQLLRNQSEDKLEDNFILGIIEGKGRLFLQVGATFKPEGIVAGFGIKI